VKTTVWVSGARLIYIQSCYLLVNRISKKKAYPLSLIPVKEKRKRAWRVKGEEIRSWEGWRGRLLNGIS